MKRVILILVLANLGQAPAVKGGTVTGSVVAVAKGKPVKVDELYVYLEGTEKARTTLGDGVTAKIEQKNTKFSPFVTIVPVGAKVFFPNRDADEHSVFSPAMKLNNWIGFDLGRYHKDQTGRHRKFAELGEFDIYCDIHKEMWAKVKAVPSRHYAKVVDGKYTITDVPPGSYKVIAWSPDSRESKSQLFEVTVEGTAKVESLNLQHTPRSASHKRRDGSDYGPYP